MIANIWSFRTPPHLSHEKLKWIDWTFLRIFHNFFHKLYCRLYLRLSSPSLWQAKPILGCSWGWRGWIHADVQTSTAADSLSLRKIFFWRLFFFSLLLHITRSGLNPLYLLVCPGRHPLAGGGPGCPRGPRGPWVGQVGGPPLCTRQGLLRCGRLPDDAPNQGAREVGWGENCSSGKFDSTSTSVPSSLFW